MTRQKICTFVIISAKIPEHTNQDLCLLIPGKIEQNTLLLILIGERTLLPFHSRTVSFLSNILSVVYHISIIDRIQNTWQKERLFSDKEGKKRL